MKLFGTKIRPRDLHLADTTCTKLKKKEQVSQLSKGENTNRATGKTVVDSELSRMKYFRERSRFLSARFQNTRQLIFAFKSCSRSPAVIINGTTGLQEHSFCQLNFNYSSTTGVQGCGAPSLTNTISYSSTTGLKNCGSES